MKTATHRIIVANDASDQPVPGHILSDLLDAASAEDAGTQPISRSINLLREAGLLTDDGTANPVRTARALMRVGAANLSVGRLFEGHINALRLIGLYGSAAVRKDIHRQIEAGAVLGVWGADGAEPVTISDDHLTGSKCFASGIGTVTHAIVTVNSGPEVRLALVDVTDPDCADISTWDVSGMRASASGSYEFGRVPVADVNWLGAPGDYMKEPHFVGGVWRIAALQVGAATGMLDHAARDLRTMGRIEAEAQKTRLMTVLTQAWAGMALVEQAAAVCARRDVAVDNVVATSIAARLFTEEVGLDAIKAVEQSIGLRHFSGGSQTGRMARDLSVYLRQAARDAFLMRAADTALVQQDNIWGVFE